MQKFLKKLIVLSLCVCFFSSFAVFAETHGVTNFSGARTVVRVGFPHIDGCQMIDETDTKSGYMYDYLQYIKQFAGWDYEYLGYTASKEELQQMLLNGEIDMVCFQQKTPENEALFDFSAYPSIVSASCLEVRADDFSVCSDKDYDTYNALIIGAVKDSVQIQSLESFAREKHFIYYLQQYDNVDALTDALAEEEIDAIVTSNLRLSADTRIIDQFTPCPMYIAVKKGNTTLLNEVNYAMEIVALEYPNLSAELYNNYYSSVRRNAVYLSAEEKAFVKKCQEDGDVFYAVLNPECIPYSYFSDGEPAGILGAAATKIIERTGLDIRIVETKNYKEYLERTQSSDTVIRFDMLYDYNVAEKEGFTLSKPLFSCPAAMLMLKEFSGSVQNAAVLKDSYTAQSYVEKHFKPENIQYYTSYGDCVSALLSGKCDAVFLYSQAAQYVNCKDSLSRFTVTTLPDSAVQICIGVRDSENFLLASVLSKATNACGTSFLQNDAIDFALYPDGDVSILNYFYANPLFGMYVIMILCISVIIILFFLYMRKKIQLENDAYKRVVTSNEQMHIRERRLAQIAANEYIFQLVINLDTLEYNAVALKHGTELLVPESGNYRAVFSEFLENCILPEDRRFIWNMHSPDAIMHQHQSAPERPVSVQHRMKTKNGNIIWVKTIDYYLEENGIPFCYRMFKDITETIHQEEKLTALTKAFQAVSNNFISIYLVNLNEREAQIIKIPDYMDEMLVACNYDFFEMIHLYVSKIDKSRIRGEFSSYVTAENVKELLKREIVPEITYQSVYDILVTLRIYKANGYTELNPITVWVFENASEKARIQEELHVALKEAQSANTAKSRFLANMSHDIRTPMNSIIGMTDIALQNEQNPEKVHTCLTKIDTASRHLLLLINDILDMSTIECGKISLNAEPVDIIDLLKTLEGIVKNDAEAKQQKITVDTSAVKHQWVQCDRLRLSQVFINIVGNAVKFTPDQGEISIVVKELFENEETGIYHFTFTDTGIGIKPEFINHVFEAFEQEKRNDCYSSSGTGLGMAITKNIITLMGGTITCRSKSGSGTTFVVNIPLQWLKDVPDFAIPKNTSAQDDFEGKRILLAEDIEINSEIAVNFLESLGFQVETAMNGLEAVRKFEESPEYWYSLIFMDIRMPELNGYDATKRIRASIKRDASSIPIVAMTANAFAEDRRESLEAGMNNHIAKPLDKDEILRVVRQLLRK